MTLEEFEKALQYHDWYYEYSDDHSVWRRGLDRQRQLEEERRRLTAEGHGDKVEELWQRYSP